MRARLLFSYGPSSLESEEKIIAPPLLVEDGMVGLYTTDWVRILEGVTLDTITEELVRTRLGYSKDTTIILPPAREMPEVAMYAPEMTQWRQDWWQEVREQVRSSIVRETLRAA